VTPVATSPVSFLADVRRLPRKGMAVRIEADERQRGALAAEHGLLAVESFVADLLVRPWKSEGVRVEGSVAARIVQACAVTLDPVDARIDEEVEALFVPEGSRLARPRGTVEGEILLDPEGPDAPETFAGDTIDVGALAEEFFGLAIDPYPRAPGAPAETAAVSVGDKEASPFAKLLSLKPKS
jgi:uncharacterized metal-binding protein YceD (DUF177 family)